MLTKGAIQYPNTNITALASSKSKVYCISDKNVVRSLPESAKIDHTSIFMQGHSNQINSISFPSSYGEVFASGSGDEIRIWNLYGKELLRIELKQD